MQRSDASDDFHFGHELETGMVARAREWTDLFPFLRLIRTLRTAGSPPLIVIVAVTFAIWWAVLVNLLGLPAVTHAPELSATPPLGGHFVSPQEAAQSVSSLVRQTIPTTVFDVAIAASAGIGWWAALLGIAWSLLAWTPAVMLLVRQGALLTAGRPMSGLRHGVTTAIRLAPAAWLVAVVPLVCVLSIAIAIYALGWLSRPFAGIFWAETTIAVIIAVVAVPCGVLGFGANVAVPLGWAALANERDRDILDSLSRGFEYLLRRPLHLVFYGMVVILLLTVIGNLAAAVTGAAVAISITVLQWAGCERGLIASMADILAHFPLIVILTLFWSLVGGVYLLLRSDAGGQEVEDLWQGGLPPKPSLPQRET